MDPTTTPDPPELDEARFAAIIDRARALHRRQRATWGGGLAVLVAIIVIAGVSLSSRGESATIVDQPSTTTTVPTYPADTVLMGSPLLVCSGVERSLTYEIQNAGTEPFEVTEFQVMGPIEADVPRDERGIPTSGDHPMWGGPVAGSPAAPGASVTLQTTMPPELAGRFETWIVQTHGDVATRVLLDVFDIAEPCGSGGSDTSGPGAATTRVLDGQVVDHYDLTPKIGPLSVTWECQGDQRVVTASATNHESGDLEITAARFAGPMSDEEFRTSGEVGGLPSGVDMQVEGSPAPPGGALTFTVTIDGALTGRYAIEISRVDDSMPAGINPSTSVAGKAIDTPC